MDNRVVGSKQGVNEKSRKLPNKYLQVIVKEDVFKIVSYLGSYLRELTAGIESKKLSSNLLLI